MKVGVRARERNRREQVAALSQQVNHLWEGYVWIADTLGPVYDAMMTSRVRAAVARKLGVIEPLRKVVSVARAQRDNYMGWKDRLEG